MNPHPRINSPRKSFLNYLHGSELDSAIAESAGVFLNYLHGSEPTPTPDLKPTVFLNYLHGSELEFTDWH